MTTQFLSQILATEELRPGQQMEDFLNIMVNPDQLPALSADAAILHILRFFHRDLLQRKKELTE
jgi:hypothetical protein